MKKQTKKGSKERVASKIRVLDVVRTRSLEVYDNSNRKRISLTAYCDIEPKITIYKEDGTPAIEISSMEMDSDSRRIVLFGKKDTWRAWIGCNEKGAGIFVFDKRENCIKSWSLEEGKQKRVARRKKV